MCKKRWFPCCLSHIQTRSSYKPSALTFDNLDLITSVKAKESEQWVVVFFFVFFAKLLNKNVSSHLGFVKQAQVSNNFAFNCRSGFSVVSNRSVLHQYCQFSYYSVVIHPLLHLHYTKCERQRRHNTTVSEVHSPLLKRSCCDRNSRLS